MGIVCSILLSYGIASVAGHAVESVEKFLPHEVKFKGYKDFELVGTYLGPDSGAKVPGVLLIAGSGPTDRDGNSGALKIGVLKDMAEKLAESGVATLRFDKRAVAMKYASKFPKDPSQFNDFFSFEAFQADAEGAFACMKSQSGVDSARTAILGHSEGVLIGLSIAQKLRPKGMILAAGAGRDLGQLIVEQIGEGYSAQFTDKPTLAKLVADANRAVNAVRAGSPVPTNIHPGLKPVFPTYALRFLRTEFTLDPAVLAKQFHGPTLIIQGEKDIQISVSRDMPILQKAMPQAEVVVIKNGTHCFKTFKGAADPGLLGPVIPEALEKIAAWAKKNL